MKRGVFNGCMAEPYLSVCESAEQSEERRPLRNCGSSKLSQRCSRSMFLLHSSSAFSIWVRAEERRCKVMRVTKMRLIL